jgi:hypothetical protein
MRMGVHCLRTGLQPYDKSESQTDRTHDVKVSSLRWDSLPRDEENGSRHKYL